MMIKTDLYDWDRIARSFMPTFVDTDATSLYHAFRALEPQEPPLWARVLSEGLSASNTLSDVRTQISEAIINGKCEVEHVWDLALPADDLMIRVIPGHVLMQYAQDTERLYGKIMNPHGYHGVMLLSPDGGIPAKRFGHKSGILTLLFRGSRAGGTHLIKRFMSVGPDLRVIAGPPTQNSSVKPLEPEKAKHQYTLTKFGDQSLYCMTRVFTKITTNRRVEYIPAVILDGEKSMTPIPLKFLESAFDDAGAKFEPNLTDRDKPIFDTLATDLINWIMGNRFHVEPKALVPPKKLKGDLPAGMREVEMQNYSTSQAVKNLIKVCVQKQNPLYTPDIANMIGTLIQKFNYNEKRWSIRSTFDISHVSPPVINDGKMRFLAKQIWQTDDYAETLSALGPGEVYLEIPTHQYDLTGPIKCELVSEDTRRVLPFRLHVKKAGAVIVDQTLDEIILGAQFGCHGDIKECSMGVGKVNLSVTDHQGNSMSIALCGVTNGFPTLVRGDRSEIDMVYFHQKYRRDILTVYRGHNTLGFSLPEGFIAYFNQRELMDQAMMEIIGELE